MTNKMYLYNKCSTCRKAAKWLEKKKVNYQEIDITEKPPTKKELKEMLRHVNGEVRKLFNTSGVLYRELKIKDKLPKMTDAQAIDLLSKNGKLIKRPFFLTKKGKGAVGFKEDDWKGLV